ncbi:MAG: TIGR02996 domain-containing protein [Planctomycetaceae bacterium]
MQDEDRQAFLKEILAAPDDDAPRLIFADWLEEQGDARENSSGCSVN